MSVRYLDVGVWSIAVESDLPAVHQGLELNFGRRYSTTRPPTPRTRLTCQVINDKHAFWSAARSVVLDGPKVGVSDGVTIQYGFHPPKTWLNVARTGLIELDASNPSHCRVLLHPDSISLYSRETDPDPDQLVACPEAFFYPMMVEWIRSFGACLVHCGAVALNGRAIFLTGPPGSGKSTHVLRMLTRGASFVADDLALLSPGENGLRLLPFREVANVHVHSMRLFPELAQFQDAPTRGDGKYCINIVTRFPNTAVTEAKPGVIFRLHPNEAPAFERVASAQLLDGMHSMAWYSSWPAANRAHFELLTDWLCASEQWHVSRGYMRDHLDELMSLLKRQAEHGGDS